MTGTALCSKCGKTYSLRSDECPYCGNSKEKRLSGHFENNSQVIGRHKMAKKLKKGDGRAVGVSHD